ncbi:phosphatidylinositol 4-kinase gamma 7-like [Hibiscus syriacus]|uniref:O-fucosyltransferase family protein n=1 Tax=Hibiscus syriacus TaxID=106335 RepID=A0A6A2XDJ4_HIBSY|nr:rhamnogalacturonan I rhamnosyltransferase 1-like [Hibiscus syriacus]KAE8667670.1 phosphatidylinositol 4-kinase gamma 7-like [Hibiscus syriacus]
MDQRSKNSCDEGFKYIIMEDEVATRKRSQAEEMQAKKLEVMGAATSKFCRHLTSLKVSAAMALLTGTLLWVGGLLQTAVLSRENTASKSSFYTGLATQRVYRNNGYLVVIANGGLNQRRLAIVDMIVVARYLNVTLIVPLFDNGTYWNDNSTFADIFDLNHLITSLKDEVLIEEEFPQELKKQEESFYSMVPTSFASLTYYYDRILPRIKQRGVLLFTLTDARVANNGLPEEFQKLRCRVNYEALRFTEAIEQTGRRIVSLLRQKGPFLVLHLRYEMDMVAFTGCVEGLTTQEVIEVTEMRHSHKDWKNEHIDSRSRRKHGSCPLTPEETALVLQALGIHRNTTIYIAAGKIYNEDKRMAKLRKAYPNLVRKEVVLEPWELRPFINHADQMAALDYIVAIESDIFIPTFRGNMAKAVEGHRRYMGFKTSILLDAEILVPLIDDYYKRTLSWDEFALMVKKTHQHLVGKPQKRKEIPDHPRYEDFFYSNPQECLPPFPH